MAASFIFLPKYVWAYNFIFPFFWMGPFSSIFYYWTLHWLFISCIQNYCPQIIMWFSQFPCMDEYSCVRLLSAVLESAQCFPLGCFQSCWSGLVNINKSRNNAQSQCCPSSSCWFLVPSASVKGFCGSVSLGHHNSAISFVVCSSDHKIKFSQVKKLEASKEVPR